MADNIETNPGTGGAILATDDIGGVQHPRTKVGFGVDGVYGDVSAANPLPVAGPLTDTQLRAAILEVLPSARAADYWPGYGGTADTGTAELTIDPGGALITRGAVPPQGLDIIRDEQGRMVRVLPPQQQGG